MIRLLSCRRGASAVEFAMLLPVFLSLVFGIVVFGSYLAVVHGLQQLAAEAARSSVAGMSSTERSSIATSYVSANIGTYPLISPNNVSVSAAVSGTDPNVFVVTVSYKRSRHVPFFTAVRADATINHYPFSGHSVRRILRRPMMRSHLGTILPRRTREFRHHGRGPDDTWSSAARHSASISDRSSPTGAGPRVPPISQPSLPRAI